MYNTSLIMEKKYMRVLVTGGTGFVGSNLSKKLVELGHDVTITGSSTECKVNGVKKLDIHLTGINWDVVREQEVIFHQAANNDTTDMNKNEMFRANVTAPMTLVKEAVKGKCKQFIYASSTAVYGDSTAPYIESTTKTNPLNPYAESKLAFEQSITSFAKRHPELNTVGLRYCNVYGFGESHKGKRASMIHQMIKTLHRSFDFVKLFKDGEQKRDWIFVEDVVKANLLAMEYKGNGIFNCGSGQATTFNKLVEIICGFKDSIDLPIKYIDNPYRGAYQSYTECDLTLIKKELGFEPDYNIEKGIKELLSRERV